MSYEGFEQHICEKGHYFEVDAMETFMGGDVHCECGAKSAWENSVDETNCEGVGYIPYEELKARFLRMQPGTCTCDKCGHKHKLGEDEFYIPTKEKTDPLRTIRNPTNPDDIRLLKDCGPNFDW